MAVRSGSGAGLSYANLAYAKMAVHVNYGMSFFFPLIARTILTAKPETSRRHLPDRPDIVRAVQLIELVHFLEL